MKEDRTLTITFERLKNLLEKPRPADAGAMAWKAGLGHEWFHNHNNETGGLHHRYPHIQYKAYPYNSAFRPMLLCMEEGIAQALANHTLSFARGVGWIVPRHCDVRITKVISDKYVLYKGVNVLSFSLEFKTPLSLPEGKGRSVGFGVVRRQRAGYD